MLCHTVILAAGHGSRFTGNMPPKPLIPVLGQPMIQHPLTLAKYLCPAPYVVCHYSIAEQLHRLQCVPVTVQHVLPGPAVSLLCMNGQLPEEEPVVVMMCDDVIHPESFGRFYKDAVAQFATQSQLQASVMTTLSPDQSENWSFVSASGVTRQIGYIQEKQRISNKITCGVYVFRKWRVLRQAICRMIADNHSWNSEFFVAPIINHIAGWAQYYDIQPVHFQTVGTPEQLAFYENLHGTHDRIDQAFRRFGHNLDYTEERKSNPCE